MKKSRKIWVRLFKKNGRLYCYEVGSNNIFQISQLMTEILKKYDYSNRSQIVNNLGKKYDKEDILNTIQTIDDIHEKNGGFIFKKKIQLRYPFNQEEYQTCLSNLVHHMILNITENCNFLCKYCIYSGTYRYSRVHRNNSMSWPTIKASIDFLVENSKYIRNHTNRKIVLGFYGGEPLLEESKVFRAIKYVKDQYPDIFPKFGFTLSTNGSLLDGSIIKKLIEYNFMLYISLDGPIGIHDRYRVFKNSEGSFTSVIEKLNLIRKIDEKYFDDNVNFNVVMAPEFKVKETLDFFRYHFFTSRNVNRVFSFLQVDPNYTTFYDKFNKRKERKKYNQAMKKFKKEYIQNKILKKEDGFLDSLFDREFIDIHNRYLFELPDEVYPNGICLPGIKKLFVDCDGNFHMCEKVNPYFKIGTIRDGFDVKRIFSLINEYIKIADYCENCWAIRFCKDCFLSTIKGNEFSKERKRVQCKNRRAFMLSTLKTYIDLLSKNPRALNHLKYSEDDITDDAFKLLNKYQA